MHTHTYTHTPAHTHAPARAHTHTDTTRAHGTGDALSTLFSRCHLVADLNVRLTEATAERDELRADVASLQKAFDQQREETEVVLAEN